MKHSLGACIGRACLKGWGSLFLASSCLVAGSLLSLNAADLVRPVIKPSKRPAPKEALPGQSRQVLVSTKLLDQESFELPLFEGESLALERSSHTTLPNGDQVWSGRIAGEPLSRATFAVRQGVLSGTVDRALETGNELFEIAPFPGGHHLFRHDPTRLPASFSQTLPAPIPVGRQAAAASDSSPSTQPVIDLLVVYTPASAARYGKSGIESKILQAVADANAAFVNSGIEARFALVHMAQVEYVEKGTMSSSLASLQRAQDGVVAHRHRRGQRPDLQQYRVEDRHRLLVPCACHQRLGDFRVHPGGVQSHDPVNNDAPIPEHILRRKGSPNTDGVPEEVRHLLNTGRIEAVNLSEWLIVDQGAIAAHCLPALGLGQHVQAITAALDALEALGKSTTPKRNAAVASALHTGLGSTRAVERALKDLRQHPSDVIRSWACELVAAHAPWSLADKLDRIRPLAADANMGVRECAWMAVRNDIAVHLEEALSRLVPFVLDPDPNIRRFATEATRPRGVWCRHIHALRENPAKGLILLEPVRTDPSRYVQNSVANWLNDASKSQPDWVQDVCRRWQKESPTAETAYICRRALRTLTKSAKAKP